MRPRGQALPRSSCPGQWAKRPDLDCLGVGMRGVKLQVTFRNSGAGVASQKPPG